MILALAALAQVYTDGRPVPGFPTAKSLYVACKSYRDHIINPDAPRHPIGDTDPAYCGLLGIQVIMQFDGNDKAGPHYCAPDSADISLRMTEAFLRFYEKSPNKWANMDGRPVFIQAMIDTWPCQ